MSQDEIREDVLYAFAVEPNRNRETLERYLKDYPQFSDELIDLSAELRLQESCPAASVKPVADPTCESAWATFTSVAANASALINPFADFRGQAFVALCNSLRLPRSIVVALRDRLVEPASIPASLVKAISDLSNASTGAVQRYFAQPPTTLATMEFKANQKPVEIERTTFEKLLESTDLTENQRDAVTEYVGDGQSN